MATGTTTAALPAPFTWAGDHVAIDLGHGGRALFTTRRGGVSEPPFDTLDLGLLTGDDLAAVAENRRRALAATGCADLAHGRQMHETTVVRVRDRAQLDEVLDADGQATALPDVATLALTADCLPVALATPHAVAMVHAGWRGLADGVLEEGVRAIREVGGEEGPLTAAIGPAAGGCCYEVGDEVRAALGLAPLGSSAPVDLKALARERLVAAGADAVHDVGLCTMCSDAALLFSHRRDGPRTGRQGGLAWRSSLRG